MRKFQALAASFIAIALAATPVAAQERDPVQRQTLVDLAYVLGEAHALRQVCEGPGDQFWRTRMLKMLTAENTDQGLEQRLRETFNTGYVARQAQYTTCSNESREAENKVAANGARLARKLIVAPPEPELATPK